MNIEVEVLREQESLRQGLVLLNLRVDSFLQSMKVQSTLVDNMVMTLKRIIENASSDNHKQV